MLQGLEVGIVLIVGVVASGVEQGVVGRHTDDGVDMSIGVITAELAMMNPDDALGTQAVFQFFFYLLNCARLVAFQQAERGCHDGASAIALYGSSFEFEVFVVFHLLGEVSFCEKVVGDVVVVGGRVFATPSIESELQVDGLAALFFLVEVVVGHGQEGEGTMIACPRVIDGALAE